MFRFFAIAATLLGLLFNNYHAAAQQGSDSVILSQMRKLFYGMKFNDIRNDALVTIKDMPKDSPVLIIYFKTDCGHCRLDAERMGQLAPAYQIPIWMTSYMDKTELQAFSKEFKLEQIPNLRVLHDFSKGMHNWFDFKYVPFIVLVDGKGNFIKEFNVLPSPDELKEVIRTNDFLEMYQH